MIDTIVKKAQRGSPEAFAALYKAHKPNVLNLCFSMTHDIDKSEDLTQDTFLNLYQKIRSFRGKSKFSTWLHSMTRNMVLMDARRAKNQFNRMFTEAGTEDAMYAIPSLVSDPALHMDLARAIGSLEQPYREAVISHHVWGLEERKSSKIRTYRARIKLRAYLGG